MRHCVAYAKCGPQPSDQDGHNWMICPAERSGRLRPVKYSAFGAPRIRMMMLSCRLSWPLVTYPSAHKYAGTQRPLFGRSVRLGAQSDLTCAPHLVSRVVSCFTV